MISHKKKGEEENRKENRSEQQFSFIQFCCCRSPTLIPGNKQCRSGTAQWVRTAKNRDVSTGSRASPFACLLAPLTHSLAPDCLLCSRPPLCSRSLVNSPAHFAHSLARGTVIDKMAIYSVFFFYPGPQCKFPSFEGGLTCKKSSMSAGCWQLGQREKASRVIWAPVTTQ